ncbi:MAG: hypothetical protein IJ574_05850 [Bacilli bacterium]|nr:hypothetical protein [Bacilli bacterium]
MKYLKSVFKQDNMITGYLYFYVHFITEIVCFFYLSRELGTTSLYVWLIPLLYDALAFVPQSLIGAISDKYPKINIGLVGVFLLILAIVFKILSVNLFIPLIILCLGNGCLHIEGATTTLTSSKGKLSHSAIFVGGGSFGVITGRIMAKSSLNISVLIPLILTMIPFILLASTYKNRNYYNSICKEFDYQNKHINSKVIVWLMLFVVIIRGYIGYGIPTSWNKTTYQAVLLYSFMGIGKCLGGILSDAFGIRKVAMLSTIVAIPFLIFGDNYMTISLIGVMFFSMTMAITLAMLVSVLKRTPGLAFGITTIGLFLGTLPIFFYKVINNNINIILIVISSLLCSYIMMKVIDKEGG